MTIDTLIFAGSAGAGGAIFVVIALAGLIVAVVTNALFGKDFGKKERDPVTLEYKSTPDSQIAGFISFVLWAGAAIGLLMLFGALLKR